MTVAFDLAGVVATEFGVGRDGETEAFRVVPVDGEVKAALLSMTRTTREKMDSFEGGGLGYEPSEKHGGTEYLVAPAGRFDAAIRELQDAENIPLDSAGLADTESITSYFARFTDGEHRRLTAMRRATQFKGVLKSRLIRLANDTMRMVEDKVFKLDTDFDLLVDSSSTHIWRPSAFEFLGGLKQAVLDAVPGNVGAVAADLPFVDLTGVEMYAKSRPRAARYLASIRSQELKGVDRRALIRLCDSTEVGVQEVNGKVMVTAGNEMGFLEVLDRRRYLLELVPSEPERFRAGSRERI